MGWIIIMEDEYSELSCPNMMCMHYTVESLTTQCEQSLIMVVGHWQLSRVMWVDQNITTGKLPWQCQVPQFRGSHPV